MEGLLPRQCAPVPQISERLEAWLCLQKIQACPSLNMFALPLPAGQISVRGGGQTYLFKQIYDLNDLVEK